MSLDYDFNTSCSRLFKIRLHQPTDVAKLQNRLKDLRDLCFTRGVAYVTERGNACIRFEDLDGKVRLNPNSLRSRAGLERTLSDCNLSIVGTVPTLRKRLSQLSMKLEARVTNNMLQTNVPLSKPAAVCLAATTCFSCYCVLTMVTGIHHLESTAKSDSSVVYFAATEKSPL